MGAPKAENLLYFRGTEVDMFDLANWGNPETLMLNLTNLGMGLFMAWILLAVVFEIAKELAEHRRNMAHRRH
jgi:hypothetical protein